MPPQPPSPLPLRAGGVDLHPRAAARRLICHRRDHAMGTTKDVLEAPAAARRVSGVTSVHNHLEVVLPPGNERDDAMLTTAANNALALNITVPDGVEATAWDGNLQLTGTVGYGSQRAGAERA